MNEKTGTIESETTTYSYERSRGLFERASAVIPNGIYGHFNPVHNVPDGSYPLYVDRAKGCRFWDVDGNEFIDYMCAFGPMILGYGNEAVDGAYRDQAALADTTTLASPRMVELAEYLVDLIPIADWAYFAKNGADVTGLATMVARAVTGRTKIVAIRDGYHGSAPWMQGPDRPGVIEQDHRNVIRIPWNDVSALEFVIEENDDDIAAFISTPYHHPAYGESMLPAEGYWEQVEGLLRKNGIVLISDDVRCGFRVDMGGSNEYFGYKPDLICFCKALANGYPISALVGSDALREEAAQIFHTGSYWFSAAPMAAALACLKELKRLDAPQLIRSTGEKLVKGLGEIARSHGFDLSATGISSMPYIRLIHEDGIKAHRRLCGECTQRGAFFSSYHNWFLSTSHDDAALARTWEIFEDGLKALEV